LLQQLIHRRKLALAFQQPLHDTTLSAAASAARPLQEIR
jgi:hypothetical protein